MGNIEIKPHTDKKALREMLPDKWKKRRYRGDAYRLTVGIVKGVKRRFFFIRSPKAPVKQVATSP